MYLMYSYILYVYLFKKKKTKKKKSHVFRYYNQVLLKCVSLKKLGLLIDFKIGIKCFRLY